MRSNVCKFVGAQPSNDGLLVLASASRSRSAMLEAAGVSFRTIPAQIDERSLEAGFAPDILPSDIALALARSKAESVSAKNHGTLVLGSDSLVVLGGQRFDKPRSKAEAAEHLRAFSGQEMALHSVAVLMREGAVVGEYDDVARLSVRDLSDAFIDEYLDAEWPEVSHCVGVFRIEGPGVQLFSAISGDQFTVLGMPLLQVLGGLREQGYLLS